MTKQPPRCKLFWWPGRHAPHKLAARVAELADAPGLGPGGYNPWGFKSLRAHHCLHRRQTFDFMDADLREKLNSLAGQDRFGEIVELIEQIPESDRDWETIGWYVRSLNNNNEHGRAAEVSLQYEEQGKSDSLWHYRYGYALWYLDRDQEAKAAFIRAKELADDGEPVIEWVDEMLAMIEEYETAERLRIERQKAKAQNEIRRYLSFPPLP